jgi:hypothetical protein
MALNMRIKGTVIGDVMEPQKLMVKTCILLRDLQESAMF